MAESKLKSLMLCKLGAAIASRTSGGKPVKGTTKLKVVLVAVLTMSSFCLGIVIGRKGYPLFSTLHQIYARAFGPALKPQTEDSNHYAIEPEYYQYDVRPLISIRSEADVATTRKRLFDFIWPGQGLPVTKIPSEIDTDIRDERCQGLEGLKRIDKITVRMDYGLDSIIYHFIPAVSNNRLVIFHAGHMEDFREGGMVLSFFLRRGYAVLGISMPLMGMNSRPLFDSGHNGRFRLVHHNQFSYLPDPIKFFVEPVVVALNYTAQAGYEAVYMIGVSGGGWTTTMCAALDPRILKSYPVAGSSPLFLLSEFEWRWLDYEQTVPDLYRIANFPELYVLGSYGEGRRQLQVLNQFDTCCFYGVKYQVYEGAVKEAVGDLKLGSFAVLSDTTHRQHKISAYALEMIALDMEHKQ